MTDSPALAASLASLNARRRNGVFVHAGLWRRAFGCAFDVFVISNLVDLALQPAAVLVVKSFFWEHRYASSEEALSLALFVPTLLIYYMLFEGRFGRTPGKWVTGTQVVTDSERRPGWRVVMGRTICRLIPFDFVSIYFNARRRSWHDLLSSTHVVVHRA